MWLSIAPNFVRDPDTNIPTNFAQPKFNIKIKGDKLSGSCELKDGKYYQTGVENDKGCTVRLVHLYALLLFPSGHSTHIIHYRMTGRSPLWRRRL